MLDFAKFVNEAMPKVDELALELLEHYHPEKMKCSKDLHFSVVVKAFYANGKPYETSTHTTPITEMQSVIDDANRYHWSIDYNPETKVFKFEKHFPNGMYRIATYTPINANAIDINVHE